MLILQKAYKFNNRRRDRRRCYLLKFNLFCSTLRECSGGVTPSFKLNIQLQNNTQLIYYVLYYRMGINYIT